MDIFLRSYERPTRALFAHQLGVLLCFIYLDLKGEQRCVMETLKKTHKHPFYLAISNQSRLVHELKSALIKVTFKQRSIQTFRHEVWCLRQTSRQIIMSYLCLTPISTSALYFNPPSIVKLNKASLFIISPSLSLFAAAPMDTVKSAYISNVCLTLMQPTPSQIYYKSELVTNPLVFKQMNDHRSNLLNLSS